ncbi:hypothetical protein AeMF1_020279 [Aphanomyces euteiches]|nr:hypothetical protein AeMF1_020279 [Aphanomyces euteiches]
MKDLRRDSKSVQTLHLAAYVEAEYPTWLDEYLDGKGDSGYDSFLHLLWDFAHRHGFGRRVACPSMLKQKDLEQTQLEWAADFWNEFDNYEPRTIFNVDETGIYFDMTNSRTWARKGESSKTDKSQKHSDRMTAVLTIAADGSKHPILFIVKGQQDGRIEQDELATYPPGHSYAVQKNAWMDTRVWETYQRKILQNAEEKLLSTLVPLPKNSTSVCQPLDVGVMGPFKSMLRREWVLEEIHRICQGTNSVVLTAREKRLASIKRVIRVWEAFDAEVVMKSFRKAIPKVYKL